MDAASSGFQCASSENEPAYFLKLNDGSDLECSSSQDLEIYLKRCQVNHQITKITLCSYQKSDQEFLCQAPDESALFLPVETLDNFICLSPKDRRRMNEACTQGQIPVPQILARWMNR